jgi:DNA-binding response OmpR family regulator
MRILLIEDDPVVASSLVRGFGQHGHDVDWVKDGAAAAAALRDPREEFNVTLLDLAAPLRSLELTELKAHVRTRGRRHTSRIEARLRAGDLTLDPSARTVLDSEGHIQLTAREYALLHALMQRPGAILSRPQLEARIYGWCGRVESNAIEFLLHALRRKIGHGRIQNVRGVGWRIADAA